MSTKFYPFGAQTFTLGSSVSSTDTSILLSSFIEPVTGTPYTMALINSDIAYGTIGPRTSSAEFISFTGITQNADGTATLTGVVRGLAKKYPFTTDAAYKLPHAGQSIFIISDAPQVFNQYSAIGNDETITGVKTFSSFPVTPSSAPTTDYQVVNKKYVTDNAVLLTGDQTIAGTKIFSSLPTIPVLPLADTDAASKKYTDDGFNAGAANASTTVKGIAEEATAAEITAGTQVGGTGAELFVNPKYLKDTGLLTKSICLTLIAKPVAELNTAGATFVTIELATNTTMNVGQIYVPFSITINEISYYVQAVGNHGSLKIGLYSEDGQTQYIGFTTADITTNGQKTETLSPAVTLNPGIYYLSIVPVGTADINLFNWVTSDVALYGYASVSGKAVVEGTLTVTAGTLPATITPSAITGSPTRISIIRFDN